MSYTRILEYVWFFTVCFVYIFIAIVLIVKLFIDLIKGENIDESNMQ